MYQLLKYFIMLCFASNRPLPMTLWIAWYAKLKTEKAFTLVHFFSITTGNFWRLPPAESGGRCRTQELKFSIESRCSTGKKCQRRFDMRRQEE